MDNSQDFGMAMVVILLVSVLMQLIPLVIIGIGGILCLRKSYKLSGALLLGSLLPSFVGHFGAWGISRLTTGSGQFGALTLAYVAQVFGFLGNVLMASGVVTLISAASGRPQTK